LGQSLKDTFPINLSVVNEVRVYRENVVVMEHSKRAGCVIIQIVWSHQDNSLIQTIAEHPSSMALRGYQEGLTKIIRIRFEKHNS